MADRTTNYARSGDVSIAYDVQGEGPDLVLCPGFVSHLELSWEDPDTGWLPRRLASFCRLIRFDKRGTGMSDRGPGAPSLEERMDDLRAVLDAAGSERPSFLGISEGGPLALTFAATHPERVTALALYASYARVTRSADYPYGRPRQEDEASIELIHRSWGTGSTFTTAMAPGLHEDSEVTARRERLMASPGVARDLLRMSLDIDVRNVLPVISAPTLVMHREGDTFIPVDHSRYLADHIAGARLALFPGSAHRLAFSDAEPIVAELEEFLTGARGVPQPDRVLATVLFTDIVDSTGLAARVGDERWRQLLEAHDRVVRAALEIFRGREVHTTGDGFLAAFDGPGRAIRCGHEIVRQARKVGLDVRCGVHTGECEDRDGDLAGLAVHIGARVAAFAGGGEVLVSQTVKDLVVGTGIDLRDRGRHSLKGVPGEWQLYEARA